MPLDRMLDLSDGIFAFTLTLLILGIETPALPPDASQAALLRHFESRLPELATYVISFIHIGSYWSLHHGVFIALNRTNRTLLQMNLLFLLTVTFLPYPTALLGEYGTTLVVNYALLSLIGWYAHSRPELAEPGVLLPFRRLLGFWLLLPLGLSLLGTLLAFSFTRLSFLFFFVVALTNVLPPQ